MRLIKYAGGSDAGKDTSVLADTPVGSSKDGGRLDWSYDRTYHERAGDLQIGLDGLPSAGSSPDTYELVVSPSELGAMLAVVRLEDVKPVVEGFLARADPEVVGAVVGWVVAHLAKGKSNRRG